MTTLMLSQSLCNDLLGSEYMRGYVVSHRNVELAEILANEATKEKNATDRTHLESLERHEVHSSTPARYQTYSYNINLPGEGFYDDNGEFIHFKDMHLVETPGWQTPSSGWFSTIGDGNADPHSASSPPLQDENPPTPASFHSYDSDCDRIDKRTASSRSPEPSPTDPETSTAPSLSPLFEPLFKQITPEQRAHIGERRKALLRARHHYSPGRKELSVLAGDDETDPTSSPSKARSHSKKPQKRRRHGAAKGASSTSSPPNSSDISDSFEVFPPTKRLRKDPSNAGSPIELMSSVAPSTRPSPNRPTPAKPHSTTPPNQAALTKTPPTKPSLNKPSSVKASTTKAMPIKLAREKAPTRKAPPPERRLSKLLGSHDFNKS
ncbi:hypothetical protein V2W45_1242416 [Cenococcum geophilum]